MRCARHQSLRAPHFIRSHNTVRLQERVEGGSGTNLEETGLRNILLRLLDLVYHRLRCFRLSHISFHV